MESAFSVESPAFVAIRAVLSVCVVGLLGALGLRFVVLTRYAGPDREAVRSAIEMRLPRWLDGLGLAAVAATGARLIAQHAAVFGSDADVTGDTLAALLFRSGWGRTWWLALGAAVVVTWVAPRLPRRAASGWSLACIGILALAASQPLSGHPAAAAAPTLATATQLVHLIAAGGWVGSLALLTLVAIPAARLIPDGGADAPHVRVAALVRAFSPLALVCSALLGLTGVVTALDNLGGLAPLWQTPYGRTLLTKLGLLSIAVGTGAYNWRRVLPQLGSASATERLRRSSLIELGAALLVLVATAVLVATPMPGE